MFRGGSPKARALALTVALAITSACTQVTQSGQRAPSEAVQPAPSSETRARRLRQPSAERIPILPEDAVWGEASAPVTIVQFTDLECPFCASAETTLTELKKAYGPAQLRLVVKHFPFHENSEQAARAAQAVLLRGGDAAFFRFVALAYQHQRELGSEELLLRLAERAGVARAAVSKDATSEAVTLKLLIDAELVRRLGVRGTPTFFVNGAELSGAQPLPEFRALIDAELAAARELVASGVQPELVYATRVGVNAVGAAAAAEREQTEDSAREQQAAAEATVIWKVPVAGTPMRGPRDALVTIVEFSDYECTYCRSAQNTIDQLFALYPGQLRLSRRERPLAFHARALPAAHFALEARAQRGDAGYFEAAHKLYLSALAPEHLDDIARELKLDAARMRRAIEQQAHAATIERDQELAVALKVHGTPHFFVNGWRLSGAQPLSEFRQVIDAQLKVAKALTDKGVPRARVYDELMKSAKEPSPERWAPFPASADAPSRGPKAAPVTVEVFADLQCPFCARSAETLEQVLQAFPGKVRLVFRHLPLESIHPKAREAARAAIEARAQQGDTAFWAMVDAFYRDRGENDAFSEARLRAYAAKLGLDAERLLSAVRDTRHDAVIDADVQAARSAGMEGAPSFSVNGYRIVGAQPLEVFRYVVRAALKKK